ncbi:amidohydrolase family protein [Maribacter sp. MAR_2009_72]|uniref:amidohydrolase family protein n=1 Tax=Maribacter sp. MAR_2009_72 TaxID=1250050 RepID=UPI00119C3004|nr:amidohydrolase family protein [Maribacter sp. MAR_2009_72]TVZ14339.1 putative TIM-barrel fold metal-dependent hydrolase [Maribacter sp. MAR_2009_72]
MKITIQPKKLVDAHIHLFNARYLPLKAIIKKVFVLKPLAGPLAKLLNAITDDFDMDNIAGESANFTEHTPKTEVIEWLVKRTHTKLLEETGESFIEENLRNSNLFEALIELAKQRRVEQTGGNSFSADDFLDKNSSEVSLVGENKAVILINQMFESSFNEDIEWSFSKLGSEESEKELQKYIGHEHIPVLTFLALMLSNEAKIYEQAINGYGNLKPHLLAHYMMDMKASYKKGKPYYDFHPTQSSNMMEIVKASNSKLVGFTAFNPKNENAIQSVKKGLDMGNVGVKFYPPMGYLPYGDPNSKVRKRVSDFFKICKEDEIPVFTHCTPVGFQAKKGYGLNSDPDYWQKLLEQPSYENLRICFGHAGGGDPNVKGHDFHGWYSDEEQWASEECYARKVVELCERYPNVYCEVAHLHKIMESEAHKNQFIENLVINFSNENATFKLKDKICFGTDWHMIGIVNAQKKYYELFLEIFQVGELKNSIDDFFANNFLRYLNMNDSNLTS